MMLLLSQVPCELTLSYIALITVARILSVCEQHETHFCFFSIVFVCFALATALSRSSVPFDLTYKYLNSGTVSVLCKFKFVMFLAC